MIKCIGTKRDTKNKVLGYYLMDKNKFKRYIEKNKLKALIRGGKLQIMNLTLTSDNRLVFKDIKGETTLVTQRKEDTPKKSLKEIVIACGSKGYDYEGLHYFIDYVGDISVEAFSKGIKNAKILNGTEDICVFAFSMCENLEKVVIPNSVLRISSEAFFGCTNLTSIVIPKNVTYIGNRAFGDCYSLPSITIPDSVTSIGEKAFSACNNLTDIAIPKSVTSIEKFAFYGCLSLKKVKIPVKFEHRVHELFDAENINIEFY